MKNVSMSELRSNLLKYLQNIQKGEEITVTSRGVALATVVPVLSQKKDAKAKLKTLSRTAVIHDVITPIATEWSLM